MEGHRLAAGICGILCALSAAAADIHQCRAAGGAIAFQDRPCTPEQQTLSVRAAGRAAPSAAAAAAAAAARAERDRIEAWARASRQRLAHSLGGRAAPAAPAKSARATPPARRDADACAQARAVREAAYRRDGNRMGFDRRRELQDAVTAACGLRQGASGQVPAPAPEPGRLAGSARVAEHGATMPCTARPRSL